MASVNPLVLPWTRGELRGVPLPTPALRDRRRPAPPLQGRGFSGGVMTGENWPVPEHQQKRYDRLRRWIPLLLISNLAMLIYGGMWLLTPSGQEQNLGPWRAIGAIDPRLSPSGKTIVFSYQGGLWKIGREGGTMSRLTKTAGFDSEPAWSPNEKTIAYFEAGTSELKLIDAQSAEPLNL